MLTPISLAHWQTILHRLQLDTQPLPWKHLNQAWLLNSPFVDSTHQVLRLETDQGEFYLKWMHQDQAQQAFWQKVKTWTGYELTAGYAVQPDWIKLLQPHIGLQLADNVFAVSPSGNQAYGYVLTRQMQGAGLITALTDGSLAILAQFFADLHSVTSSEWGHPFLSPQPASSWSVASFCFVGQLGLPVEWVEAAIAKARCSEIKQFVPVMLDFRWDQLQWVDSRPIGLVDMDGWIMAPASLSLAMLEYLFNPHQAKRFKQLYAEKLMAQSIEVDGVFQQLRVWRSLYRLILFKLNWLGADNLQAWLSAPSYFDAD